VSREKKKRGKRKKGRGQVFMCSARVTTSRKSAWSEVGWCQEWRGIGEKGSMH
jgi:hypothetical protein